MSPSNQESVIPFNRPFIVGKELFYISQAVLGGKLAGDGMFTKRCNAWLEQKFAAKKVLLTTSCTTAIEMCAILAGISPGDEVIMPSYTFVSTANAFVLRGATIRFVDIRPDTLNLDEKLIEAAITKKTKAIVPVHYAGVSCEMDAILDIAKRHKLMVIEDAAQGVNATYKGRYLGTLGNLAAYSFHETKNFISGEGGALVINDPGYIERAEIIREKGTNRSKFFRGEVDKYTWVDIGSSYLPSEIIAAFLYAQLEEADVITRKRWAIYSYYAEQLAPLQDRGFLQLPSSPPECHHNAHMFYIVLRTAEERDDLIPFLRQNGIQAVFHYIPLHTSPMGLSMGGKPGSLPVTENIAPRLLRLPCYFELEKDHQDRVVRTIERFFQGHRN
ncbi:dTDP-4-amino-4,6-dideoxygalactose transaminase [candidate division KSB1 bacterium]|nr:MAG: dTDP-4-amino-4,6-dideoxygalactose transaminase [candidate division KSB1 bacterium]